MDPPSYLVRMDATGAEVDCEGTSLSPMPPAGGAQVPNGCLHKHLLENVLNAEANGREHGSSIRFLLSFFCRSF